MSLSVAVILYDAGLGLDLRKLTGHIRKVVIGLIDRPRCGGVPGALANMRGFDIPARRPFFETLVQLIISVLFISISATVTPQYPRHLMLPALVLVAVLVIVARPVRPGRAQAPTSLIRHRAPRRGAGGR